jgi:magnesium transporter
MLGVILGTIGLACAFTWGLGWKSAGVVGTSLVAVCVWANAVACLMPLLAKRFRLDPSIASAPLVTAVVDATGLLLYFGIARAWMRF